MKEKLTQYIELLFAGAEGCEDIKQEILQNTLDRYDDLIAEGKVPEAAYRLAITGIGDINEILGTVPNAAPAPLLATSAEEEDTPKMKRMRAIAIALYILCPIPLLLLGNLGGDLFGVAGICCLLAMVAFATYLMVVNSPRDEEKKKEEPGPRTNIKKAVSAVALVVYFVISFATNAWYITWLVFPIAAAVNNLIFAILDLMEGKDYEN